MKIKIRQLSVKLKIYDPIVWVVVIFIMEVLLHIVGNKVYNIDRQRLRTRQS